MDQSKTICHPWFKLSLHGSRHVWLGTLLRGLTHEGPPYLLRVQSILRKARLRVEAWLRGAGHLSHGDFSALLPSHWPEVKDSQQKWNGLPCWSLWGLRQPLEPAALELADLLVTEEGGSELEASTPGKTPKPSEKFTFYKHCMLIDYAAGTPKFTFYLYNYLISTSPLVNVPPAPPLSHNSMKAAGHLPGFAHHFISDVQHRSWHTVGTQ